MGKSFTQSAPEPFVGQSHAQYMNLTSVTIGTPSQYSNAVAAVTMANQYELTARDTVLTVFPMFGRVGFAWTLIAIYSGIKNVIMDFGPPRVMDVIENHGVTNLVPTMASMPHSLPGLEQHDPSLPRAVVFAGAPFPPSVQEETKWRICSGIYEYYGLQETGAVVCVGPAEKELRPASVGQVTPFGTVNFSWLGRLG